MNLHLLLDQTDDFFPETDSIDRDFDGDFEPIDANNLRLYVEPTTNFY